MHHQKYSSLLACNTNLTTKYKSCYSKGEAAENCSQQRENKVVVKVTLFCRYTNININFTFKFVTTYAHAWLIIALASAKLLRQAFRSLPQKVNNSYWCYSCFSSQIFILLSYDF